MDDLDDLSPGVTELCLRVAHLEWVLLGIVTFVLAVLMVGNVVVALSIPKYELIFEDMFGGKALPNLTHAVIRYGNTGIANLVAVFAPLGAFIFLAWKRRSRVSWYIALAVIAMMTLHWLTIRYALDGPMKAIIMGMQGQF